jgi:hypothetical protein
MSSDIKDANLPIGGSFVDLTKEQVEQIEKWLRDPTADLLINCLKSMAGHSLLAANRTLINEIIPERHSNESSINLDNAHKLNFAADLLLSIRRGKKKLNLLKLKLGE